jgi:uncharacterized protein
MSGTYFDTSALAKWYLAEAFSDEVEVYLQGHGPVAISTLTALEMRSLLARRRREGSIDATTEGRAFATFEDDVNRGHVVRHPVHDGHLIDAANLIARYPDQPLRALDALHLAIASGLQVHAVATADRVMADASAALGLSVVRFMT